VSDLSTALLLAFDRLGSAKDPEQLIYNLGSGRGFSVREVIEVVRRVTRQPIQVEERPRRSGDSPILVASSEKIKTELQWAPKSFNLEDIIGSAWSWRRQHPHEDGEMAHQ
jgi:UDP-glucose 4-epimerase